MSEATEVESKNKASCTFFKKSSRKGGRKREKRPDNSSDDGLWSYCWLQLCCYVICRQ